MRHITIIVTTSSNSSASVQPTGPAMNCSTSVATATAYARRVRPGVSGGVWKISTLRNYHCFGRRCTIDVLLAGSSLAGKPCGSQRAVEGLTQHFAADWLGHVIHS